MSMDLTVSETEHDVVRVFALDMSGDEAEAFVHGPGNGKPGLAASLGAGRLVPDQIESFPASDLAGLGVTHYLVDGLGLNPEQVAADRAALDGLRRSILILPSAAFADKGITLTPRAPLQPIGSYTRLAAAPPVPGPAPASARGQGTAGPDPEPDTAPGQGGSRRGLWLGLALAAIVVIGLIALVL